MNQIDERVGLQAVFDSYAFFSPLGRFFLGREKKKKINSASFTFMGSAFGYLDLVYV